MSTDQLSYTEHDRQIWDEELAGFVPSRVFDAHIHLFDRSHLPTGVEQGWSNAGLETIQSWAEVLYPGRETHPCRIWCQTGLARRLRFFSSSHSALMMQSVAMRK